MATVQFGDVFTPQLQQYVSCKNHLFFQRSKMIHFCQNATPVFVSCNLNHGMHTAIVPSRGRNSQKFEIEQKLDLREGFVQEECAKVIIDLTSKGFYFDAVIRFLDMLENSLIANMFPSFPVLLKAIGGLCYSELTKQIHGYLLKVGAMKDIYVVNSFLSTLWKCCLEDDAMRMFNSMEDRDLVSWNSMMSGFNYLRKYDESLKTFSCMMALFGTYPNRVSCLSALSACASLRSLVHGREVHAFVIKNALDADDFVLSGLLDVYVKCGCIGQAEQLFESVLQNPKKNAVLWNVMISGYADNGYLLDAKILFIQMLLCSVRPDSSTMLALFVLCSESIDFVFGKQIHALVIKMGLAMDIRVGTSLIDMYFKCSYPECGLKLFDMFDDPNIVMWGTVIMNCSRSGFPEKALDLCFAAYEQGFSDPMTLLAALRACSSLRIKSEGMVIHGMSVKLGLDYEAYIGSALVDMYVKCQEIECAEKVFVRLPVKDEVSWSSLLSGYAHDDLWIDPTKTISEMHHCGVKPKAVIIACLLPICARLSAVLQCKEIHGYIIRHDFGTNTLVNNALITAYAKLGYMESSRRVFLKMEDKDKVSWNSVILGLGLHGHADESIVYFDRMREMGLKPDHQTFTALLSACSHAGSVTEGLKLFRSMREEYMLEPKIEQYACMVDLLGRAGYLNEAHNLIMAMPYSPDCRIWGSLLRSCRIHGNERLAELVAKHIFKLDPKSIGYHVLLANLYEDSYKRNEVTRLWSKIESMGMKKSPGCSWIDVDNQIHVFTASDRSHHNAEDIYATLTLLYAELKTQGYAPQR